MPRGCGGAIQEAAINDAKQEARESVARPVTVDYYQSLKVLNQNVMNFPVERNLLFLS